MKKIVLLGVSALAFANSERFPCLEHSQICQEIYDPVCGYPDYTDQGETFPNSCYACQDKVIIDYDLGECQEQFDDFSEVYKGGNQDFDIYEPEDPQPSGIRKPVDPYELGLEDLNVGPINGNEHENPLPQGIRKPIKPVDHNVDPDVNGIRKSVDPKPSGIRKPVDPESQDEDNEDPNVGPVP